MAKLPPHGLLIGGRGVRFPASWYLYNHIGNVSARQTPRRPIDGYPPHALELQATFKAATTAARYVSAEQQLFSIKVSKATWLASRDLILSTLMARAFRVQRPNGVKIVSVPAYQDVSDLLDGIWQTKGGLLYRDGTWWKGLAPGLADEVLTSNGPNEIPSWQPPASPGGNGMAHLLQHATSTTTSATAFAFKGLTVQLDFNIEIGGVWMLGDYTISQHYNPLVAIASNPGGAGTLSSVTLGPAYVLPETLGDRWQYLPFTTPVAFSAGDLLFIGAGRSDGTGTSAFPLNGLSGGTLQWPPLPGRPRRLAQIAKASPASGDAYSDLAPAGQPGLGIAYRLP